MPVVESAPHRLTRNPAYLLWLAGDTATGLAGSLAAFAIPLLALMITDDPAQAGIIGATGLLLRVLTSVIGGVLADRHDRLVLMLAGAVIGLVLAAGFTVLALTDALTFAALLLLNALIAARTGLFGVADESALKQLVPSDAMGRAQGANQGRDALLGLVGGPLGGMLLAAGGWLVGAVMAICQLAATVTGWALLRTADAPERVRPEKRTSAMAEVSEGLRWLLARRDLRAVLAVTTIINLGFNTGMTTTIFALQQEGYSAAVIGWTGAAVSAVMLVGALVSPLLIGRVSAGLLMIVGLGAATVAMLTLPLVQGVPAILVVLGCGVILVPALNAGLLGYFTVATPDHLLGRANSALGVFAMGAMPLAPLIAGLGLGTLGRGGTLLVAGALCLVAALLAVCSPSLRSLPVESGWTDHARRFDRP